MAITRVTNNNYLAASGAVVLSGTLTKAFVDNIGGASSLLTCHLYATTAAFTGSALSDNVNGAWGTYYKSTASGALGATAAGHFFPAPAAGATTVTFTSGGTGTVNMFVTEFTGAAQSTPEDGSNGAAGNSADPSPGSIATSTAGVVQGIGGATWTSPSAGTGFTTQNSISSAYYVEDQITSASGTYTANWTAASSFWLCVATAFKEAAGGAATPHFLGLLGAGR